MAYCELGQRDSAYLDEVKQVQGAALIEGTTFEDAEIAAGVADEVISEFTGIARVNVGQICVVLSLWALV